METIQAGKSPHPLMWAAGIALIVFCGAGAAAIMGWIPTSLGKPDDAPKVEQAKASPAQAAPAKPATQAAPAKTVVAAAAKCAECGVIQSVREIETKGQGSGIGAVAGGAVGAVAGHEIEKYSKNSKTWEITVRMEDGSHRLITEAKAPTWRGGEKVKVVNGAIQSNS